jgi:preprotein translocase subunit SecF
VLTILGYSLYDTVVVFDKVRENTASIASSNRQTYSQAANLAVNQTLVRSINTSVIALLPVAGILFVGAGLLGAGTLKDLSLALFIGIAAGTYSSIFIATPLLADLKEREPAMRALRKRVEARRSSEAAATTARGAQAGVAVADPDAADELGEDDGGAAYSGARAGATRGPRQQPRRGPRNRPAGKRRR